MAISGICRCGREFSIGDEFAGRKVRCPACRDSFRLPPSSNATVMLPATRLIDLDLPVEVELEPIPSGVPASTGTPGPRPFWKDPVVMVGTAVPSAILFAFFAYLYLDGSARAFREQVHAAKARADEFAASPRTRVEAYRAYDALVAFAGDRDPGDASTRDEIEAAKLGRREFYPDYKAELDRQEAERRAAVEAARIRAERDLAEARARVEAERLSRIRAEISGGAWIINKAGQSNILRGLNVCLVRPTVRKGDVAGLLERIRSVASGFRETAETSSELRRQMSKDANLRLVETTRRNEIDAIAATRLPEDTELEMTRLHSLVRTAACLNECGLVAKDSLWPEAVLTCLVRSSVTDIDGKYEISAVPGGRYLLCATHSTERAVAEWVEPISVERDGVLSFDLYNDKATLILNKSGD